MRLWKAIFAVGLLASPALAQKMPLLGIGASTASTYSGPGDVVASAKIFYGARGYNAAYAAPGTGNALNIRRASDNATQDIVILTNGDLDIASYNTFVGTDATCTGSMVGTTTLTITACASGTIHVNDPITGAGITQPAYVTAIGTCGAGAGSCTLNAAQTFVSETVTAQVAGFIPKAYDQSGNTTDASQATASKQPQLLPICQNSKPCINFSSAAVQILVSSGNVSASTQPYTLSSVFSFVANGGAQSPITFGANVICVDKTGVNQVQMYAGSFGGVVTVNDGTWHAHQAVFNGASSVLFVDGTSNSQNPSTGNIGAATATFGGSSTCGNIMNGPVAELGFWGSGFSAGNQAAMHTNQAAYWGTP